MSLLLYCRHYYEKNIIIFIETKIQIQKCKSLIWLDSVVIFYFISILTLFFFLINMYHSYNAYCILDNYNGTKNRGN